MTVSADHGECPKCGEDLNGGSIWEFYFAHCGDEAEADRVAAQFGATRSYGRWNLALHIKFRDGGKDRWRCPECGHEWDCALNPHNLHAIADQSPEGGNPERGSMRSTRAAVAKPIAPNPGPSSPHKE